MPHQNITVYARSKGDGKAVARILYCLYSVHGTAFFKKYSSRFFLTFTFDYLAKHLKASPTKYLIFENFMSLYQKYFTLPYGVCQRYAFSIYSSDELLYGPITACMGNRGTCPAWKHIENARDAITSNEAEPYQPLELVERYIIYL